MRTLRDILDKHVFKRSTLTEIVAQELESATLESEQAQHTIRSHEFLLHMARAKIEALQAWNAMHAPGGATPPARREDSTRGHCSRAPGF